MISRPPTTLPGWLQALADVDIPVLATSALRVAELRELEDSRGTVDAHLIAQDLGNDPLMVLKVLVHVSRYCTRLSVEPPETLTGAIVMQGIEPFFKAFGEAPTAEEWLAGRPDAMAGLQAVIRRARRGAHFAYGFALHRQDEDAAVIHEAAMLHGFAEMLLWCHAPDLAQTMAERLAADPALHSRDVQREVLGVALCDLAQALMRAWQLPSLLIRCTDERHTEHPQVRTVTLAMRLARHTQQGWESERALATVPADVENIAELLNLSPEAAMRKVRDMDD